MNKEDFVHLHVHTEYSTLDGINNTEKLPEYAKGLNQQACAITDHGSVAGTYKFNNACKKAGIKPILGIEAYYTVEDRAAKEKDIDGNSYYHLVLLAKNQKGLKNLFKLSSRAFIEGFYSKPRLDTELLQELNEDIYATSSCLGSRSSQLILHNRTPEAERLLAHHAEIFKDRFFLELQLHEDEEQQAVNKVLMQLSVKNNWPLILTADCHYTEQQDKDIHELALCMQTNQKLSDEKRFTFGDIDVHFAKWEYMWSRAQRLGIPYDAIINTKYLSEQIESHTYFSDIRNRYPKFKGLPEDLTSDEALLRLSKNLLMKRFDGQIPPQEYQDRLLDEWKVIKRMGFSDYMLIQWEIIENARKIGCMPGPGRGSAAGSLISYALGITQIDPIKYDLLFSRFLNEGRAATPLIFTDDMKKIAQHYIGCELNHTHDHNCKH